MPLTEFDLIEISRRFRLLEDAYEALDRELGRRLGGRQFDRECEIVAITIKACRDDMTTMQEAIRAAQAVSK